MRIHTHNLSYFINHPINSIAIFDSIRKNIEPLLNIIIFIFLICFFYFIKLNSIKESTNNNPMIYSEDEELIKEEKIYYTDYSLNNNSINKNNFYNKSLRKLTTFFHGKYSKEDFLKKKQMKNILDKLTKTRYIGKWFTKGDEKKKLLLGDSIEGLTKIKFRNAIEVKTREEALAIIIKNYEDKYINHWLEHSSFILRKNLNITSDKNKNLLNFSGKWETDLEYGELFYTKISRRYPCISDILISFPMNNFTLFTNTSNGESFTETLDTIDNSNFTIYISSSCGFNMSMELYVDDLKRLKEIEMEINKYIIFISIILLLEMISIYLMSKDLDNNNEAINCLSLFTLIQSMDWHVYCCMTHLNWSIKNFNYFYHFNIITLLYIITVIGFDFRLIFIYWKIKAENTSNRTVVNLKISYYFSFFIFFMISIFFITDLMIYYPLIIFSGIILWTPQIIYNVVYYNKYIYPFFYIIIASIERLFYSFYFRAYDHNFFKIKGDKMYIYIMIIYIIINIIILFLQSLKGPRFFLSKKYIKEDYDFYKTKEELLELSNNFSNVDCVVCLQPIFYDDETDDNKTEKENVKDDSINTDYNISVNEISINDLNKDKKNMENNILKQKKENIKKNVMKKNKKCLNVCYFNLKEIINVLFLEGFYKFYRISKNPRNKKYMRTPCNHAFHSLCLEKWLVRKKECPNCRHNLSDLIS